MKEREEKKRGIYTKPNHPTLCTTETERARKRKANRE
jgi:hypothetical protein